MKRQQNYKRKFLSAKILAVGALVIALGFSAGYGLSKAFVISNSKPTIKKVERQTKPKMAKRRLRQPVHRAGRNDRIIIEPARHRVLIESGVHTTDHYGYVTKRTPWLYMPERTLRMMPTRRGTIPAGTFQLRRGRRQWIHAEQNGKPVMYPAQWPDILHVSLKNAQRMQKIASAGIKVVVQ